MRILRRVLDIRHTLIGLLAAAAAVWIVRPYELRMPDPLHSLFDGLEANVRQTDWNIAHLFRPQPGELPYTATERAELGKDFFRRIQAVFDAYHGISGAIYLELNAAGLASDQVPRLHGEAYGPRLE